MLWTTTLENRLSQAETSLSASRKRLIREILDHPEEIYFLDPEARNGSADAFPPIRKPT